MFFLILSFCEGDLFKDRGFVFSHSSTPPHSSTFWCLFTPQPHQSTKAVVSSKCDEAVAAPEISAASATTASLQPWRVLCRELVHNSRL